MPRLVTLGELLIDFIAQEPGVTAEETDSWTAAPGGAPANVAVGAARLQTTTSFLGKVGDDPFGRRLVATLEAEGIDVTGVRVDPAARTALAFVSLSDDGERTFSFYRHPSADMLYRADEVDLDKVRAASILHFGSISLIAEPSRSATLMAVEAAREARVTVSFDPNLRLDLWPGSREARAGIGEGIERAQIVKLSEEELEFLCGSRDLEAARELASHLELLVVTRGAGGADYLSGAGEGHVEGFEVHAVDTTGAGDSFMAALLAALAEKPGLLEQPDELREALRRANACAALTVSGRGAIPSLPTSQQVDSFLARAGGRTA